LILSDRCRNLIESSTIDHRFRVEDITMRKFIGTLAVLAFCVILAAGEQAAATNTVKNNWLAQYPDVCSELVARANDCSLCHGGGFSLNAYATAIRDNSFDFEAVESLDSDGDGRTNGEEILNDCTAPGDETSPVDAATWSALKALFDR
jgi:hypothetical protein